MCRICCCLVACALPVSIDASAVSQDLLSLHLWHQILCLQIPRQFCFQSTAVLGHALIIHSQARICVQVHSVNCFTARWNWQGIAATADSRLPRDVAGQRLKIRFEIVDKRFGVLAGPVKKDQVDPNRVQRGPYTVFLTLQVYREPPTFSRLDLVTVSTCAACPFHLMAQTPLLCSTLVTKQAAVQLWGL